MGEPPGPRSPTLARLYWRSEILQVMYWLRGEGLGDLVDPGLLERFLGVRPEAVQPYLDYLVADGALDADGQWYRLSPRGMDEGAAEFASAFADLTRPAHGECREDCWCHLSPEEAEACLSSRQRGEPR